MHAFLLTLLFCLGICSYEEKNALRASNLIGLSKSWLASRDRRINKQVRFANALYVNSKTPQ